MVRCPSCGGHDVRRSHSQGMFDAFMSSFRKRPFRCRACGRRFYKYVPASGEPDDEEDTEQDAAEDQRETGHGR